MDFKIIWSDPAIESLGNVVRHIAKDNPAAALHMGQQLLGRVEVTSRFPEVGPVYRQAGPLAIRYLNEGDYRVYHRVQPTSQSIEILAVRHGAQQQPKF